MDPADTLASLPLLGLASFAVATSLTPGPNNLLLAHSGMMFGVRRTMPALAGIYAGCAVLFAICALGVATLLEAAPAARQALALLGGAYLAYVAWRMLKASWQLGGGGLPVGFGAAAAAQLVNPKLWWMCAFTLARFAPPDASSVTVVSAVALAFMLFTVPSLVGYTVMGSLIARFARSTRARRAVNFSLAAATLATAVGVAVTA